MAVNELEVQFYDKINHGLAIKQKKKLSESPCM